jgi:hypothetical protein
MVRANYLLHSRRRDIANASTFMEAIANAPRIEPPARFMSPADVPAAMAASSEWGLPSRPSVRIDLQSMMSSASAQMNASAIGKESAVGEAGGGLPVSDEIISDLPWGTAHPDREKSPQQRARWTPFEVQFIGRWCDEALTKFPDITQIIRKCRLSLATEYPDMIAHFHVNHVISTARFVHGYRLYKKGNIN